MSGYQPTVSAKDIPRPPSSRTEQREPTYTPSDLLALAQALTHARGFASEETCADIEYVFAGIAQQLRGEFEGHPRQDLSDNPPAVSRAIVIGALKGADPSIFVHSPFSPSPPAPHGWHWRNQGNIRWLSSLEFDPIGLHDVFPVA